MDTVLESPTKRVVIGPEHPFVVIGERINPTGRGAFAEELLAGHLDRVREDAARQVEAGAPVLDVNAGVPGADEVDLLVRMVKAVMEATDAPLCIDSATDAALEAALDVYEGKALVNSVTGEHGRLERVLPLVKRHGAAVIGMANDERGISMVPEERLRAARKIVERAADHGIPPEDVVIDPLVMSVGADGTAPSVALETMRLVRDELGCNLTCGASNVSFGMPGRAALSAAFLGLARYVGLTSAIANPLTPEIRTSVLATDVLLGVDPYAMAWIKTMRAEQRAGS